MTSKTTRYPIESFGPELMAALTRGSRERVEISFKTFRQASMFQKRLHTLRKRLREDNHALWPVAARARTSLVFGERAGLPAVTTWRTSKNVEYPRDKDTPAKLVIQPHDAEFREALTSAGLTADELLSDPLHDIVPSTRPRVGVALPPDDAESALEQLLSDIPKENSK